MSKEIISVIGLGYVGLPLACLCAKTGFHTIGLDTNKNAVDLLSLGKSHIKDVDVEYLLKEATSSGNFFPTIDKNELSNSSLYLICVPTPINKAKEPDLTPLLESIETIAPFLSRGNLVVVESTVFPGTCEEEVAPLIKKLTGFNCLSDISLVHCPERVNPGDAFWTSENIPRVIGGMDIDGTRRAADFYSTILGGPVIDVRDVRDSLRPKFSLNSLGKLQSKNLPLGAVTMMRSIRDAEAVKAMENTVRDVNIAFVNELAKISDVLGLDVVDIIDGMSTKPFGKGPYYPGVGVGGHCIAVDPEWLKAASIKAGYMPELVQLSRNTNNSMPDYTFRLLQDRLNEIGLPIKGAKVAVLGVSYKRNVDDPRESPFYELRDILLEKGALLSVYDSWIDIENTHDSVESVIEGCVAVVLVTDHSDIVSEVSRQLFETKSVRIVIDGRNALDPKKLSQSIIYRGIGKR
tara:strand:+ start:4883 stop:6271 length:1389 start_codon:yes stop_codon:yes gene_type:complete